MKNRLALMLASATLTTTLCVAPAFASTYGLSRSWFTSHTPMEHTTWTWWGYTDYTWNEAGTKNLRDSLGMVASGGSVATAAKKWLSFLGPTDVALLGILSGGLGFLSNTIGRRDNGYGVTIRCVDGFPVWVYPNTP